MNKKLIGGGILLGVVGLVVILGLLDLPATAVTKNLTKPEACVCSQETMLSLSEKTADIWGKKKEYKNKTSKTYSTYKTFGQVFNCNCGKVQCVISTAGFFRNFTTGGISCVKGGIF